MEFVRHNVVGKPVRDGHDVVESDTSGNDQPHYCSPPIKPPLSMPVKPPLISASFLAANSWDFLIALLIKSKTRSLVIPSISKDFSFWSPEITILTPSSSITNSSADNCF